MAQELAQEIREVFFEQIVGKQEYVLNQEYLRLSRNTVMGN